MFTIKSHIIDLFMVGIVMQYKFEIDAVPLLVSLVYLGVGDSRLWLHGGGDAWPIGASGGTHNYGSGLLLAAEIP